MKLHPILVIIIALVALTFVVLLGGVLLHDSLAAKNTVYSPSFSDGAFKQIKEGVSREAVVAAIGEPLRREYMLRYQNESYAPHPIVPLEQLPKGASIHWELWDYSASKRFPDDFRAVVVGLDANGTVAFTSDYVTD